MSCSVGGKINETCKCSCTLEDGISTAYWIEGELTSLWGSGSSIYLHCANFFSVCFGYMGDSNLLVFGKI